MILTEKCKEKFLEWLVKNGYPLYYDRIPEILKYDVTKNALIIDFFDSVDIYIYLETATYVLKPNFRYKIITDDDTIIGFKENSRQEATIQAIKKANDLYNDTDKV